MSNRNINRIIEGLNDSYINEGTSAFSAKLDGFLKGLSTEDIKFIKSIINPVYINLGKNFGGYIEGKRPIIKGKNGYKYMTWKMQTNKSTRYQFYNMMREYMSPVKNKPFEYAVDGTRYYGIAQSLEDPENMRPGEIEKGFSLERSIFVGVASVYNSSQKIDSTKEGDTFKFIVSVPTGTMAVLNNEVVKDGQKYYFTGNGSGDAAYTITYDDSTKKFEVVKGESFFGGFVTLYKSSRNSEKAFNEMCNIFTSSTPLSTLEKILRDNNVRVSTSWYPGLD